MHVHLCIKAHACTFQVERTGPINSPVTLKLSGDSTRFSPTTSFIFLTFSFPELAKDVLAASGKKQETHKISHQQCNPGFLSIYQSGNHTYASCNGSESHDFLRDCFEPVWEEVAELIANPVVKVKVSEYTLRVVLGSDYKVVIIHSHTYTHPYIAHVHCTHLTSCK